MKDRLFFLGSTPSHPCSHGRIALGLLFMLLLVQDLGVKALR